MQPSTPDPRRRRILGLAGAMAGLLAVIIVLRIAVAPDEVEVCATVLDLAARAGEAPGEAERIACEDHFAERRARLGWLRWAKLARCTAKAKTMSDAGGC